MTTSQNDPQHKASRVVEMQFHECPDCKRKFELPKKFRQFCPWCLVLLPTERETYRITYNTPQQVDKPVDSDITVGVIDVNKTDQEGG